MEAANLFYYSASIFLIVSLLVVIVIGYRIFVILGAVKNLVEEAKMTVKSTEVLRKGLAMGGMMVASKVIASLKNKIKGGGKNG